jgi:hypothetical protein
MSWLAAILSSVVYDYHISVPFHMVFKSSILLVNMTLGAVVLRRRYRSTHTYAPNPCTHGA